LNFKSTFARTCKILRSIADFGRTFQSSRNEPFCTSQQTYCCWGTKIICLLIKSENEHEPLTSSSCNLRCVRVLLVRVLYGLCKACVARCKDCSSSDDSLSMPNQQVCYTRVGTIEWKSYALPVRRRSATILCDGRSELECERVCVCFGSLVR